MPVRLQPDTPSSSILPLFGSGTAQVLGSVLYSQHFEKCAGDSNCASCLDVARIQQAMQSDVQ